MNKECKHHWHYKYEYKHNDPLPCGARQWSYRTQGECCICKGINYTDWSYWYDDNINDEYHPVGVDR
jgi:hypothetical protein